MLLVIMLSHNTFSQSICLLTKTCVIFVIMIFKIITSAGNAAKSLTVGNHDITAHTQNYKQSKVQVITSKLKIL